MKITRIYTGADKQSHFEDLEIPLLPVAYGRESERVPFDISAWRARNPR